MITTVELPQEILESARLTVPEIKIELAVHLYEQNRLSIGKARELVEMHLWEFRQLLASRQTSPHYDETDLADDIAVLCELCSQAATRSSSGGTAALALRAIYQAAQIDRRQLLP